LYEDKDEARKKEIQALGGPNEYGEFNSRLKQIVNYHKKNPFIESSNVKSLFTKSASIKIVV